MRRRARGWSDFDNDEKLEALRADVNDALDLAERLTEDLKQTNAELAKLARCVYELTQRK